MNVAVYVHIVDHIMMKIHVWNDSDISLIILQKFCMNQIVKYKAEKCYLITAEDTVLALTAYQSVQQEWI